MQRRANIQASSLIIILSILTTLVQFIGYYFFESVFVIWTISAVTSILCCHILQEQTVTYSACFNYSALTIFMSLIVIVLTYGNAQSFLPYSSAMVGIGIINWLLPALNSFLRYMLDYGTKIDDYIAFFRNSSIVLTLFYVALIIYGNFAADAFPLAYREITGNANFVPFQVISSQIEDYLNGTIFISDIITYLLSRILIFLPYGFYMAFALRNQPRHYKMLSLLSLPILIEVLQLFLIPERCDIDDLLYAFLGGLLGTLIFLIMNLIFRAVTGRDFLRKETGYRYIGNLLHF